MKHFRIFYTKAQSLMKKKVFLSAVLCGKSLFADRKIQCFQHATNYAAMCWASCVKKLFNKLLLKNKTYSFCY